MPTTGAILGGLAAIANDFWPLAALWHAAILAVLVALERGWRPPRRSAAVALTLPLASVAALAGQTGNAFNAIAFLLLVIGALVLAPRTDGGPVELGATWEKLAGAGL